LNSNKLVACPLDCYDACQAKIIDENLKGDKEHFTTNGKLCVNFANLAKEQTLETAKYEGKDISLDEALEVLVSKLKQTTPKDILYYKGSGNIGVMQSSPKHFFAKYGSTLTKGSLCDGAGGAGLELGRKKVVNPPIENMIDSDVIIVWGRDFSITSPHMYNLVKDKTFITIDPIKTDIAKKSILHLQPNPKTDHELALLLTRFAYMEDMEDEEFIENSQGADWFFDLAKSRPVVSYEQTTGVSLNDVTKFYEIIKDKKISMVLGLGVQKYYEGAQIIRAIDSYAAYIGLHNKDYGGVWYLGDSMYGYEKKIKSDTKNKVAIPEVDFSKYELVFIQGANPVVMAPNTKRVIEGLKNPFVIYFGTTLNDTCEYANLIIPAKNFLEKKDIRVSYGHQYKAITTIEDKTIKNRISEYELTNYLNETFGFEPLEDEDSILEYYLNTKVDNDYKIDDFEFVEDLEVEPLYEDKEEEQFYLITVKSKKTLNSQFGEDNNIYLNSKSGFKTGDEVLVSSDNGEAKFIVSINDDVKTNCAMVYSSNRKANYLTTHKSDEEAFSAIYNEALLTIELC